MSCLPVPPGGCPPSGQPFPWLNPSPNFGGYPPCNPTVSWNLIPPPTGCVYGLDGSSRSWGPVPTRWEVACLISNIVNQTLMMDLDGGVYTQGVLNDS